LVQLEAVQRREFSLTRGQLERFILEINELGKQTPKRDDLRKINSILKQIKNELAGAKAVQGV
jgi:hypothetical protein